jgi:hypothetical protein
MNESAFGQKPLAFSKLVSIVASLLLLLCY